MKHLLTTILIIALTTVAICQQNTCWVTVTQTNVLERLKSQGVITSSVQALPDSRNKDLLNVYEIQTNDLISFLQIVEKNASLSKPELIEEYQSLYTPDDYTLQFQDDYALSLINAEQAWDITKGDPLISIGVLDSGYDTLHEELVGKFNHLSTMVNGANIIHGTAVAITAAGNTDNTTGKSSIGFNCELSLRNMNYNEILAATYAGVRVINVSWASGCMYNSYYQSVIDEAYNNGSVIIAAAGNGPTCGGPENLVYPAAFDHVIAVTSIDENDHHQPIPNDPTSTHQHNDRVDLSAPGYDVPLSVNGNAYLTGNGTSFAAPYVSGTVGLMLSVNPCLTPDEIETILKTTAVDIYNENPSFLGKLGAGRLDAFAAVQMAKEMHPIKVSVEENNSSCSEFPGVFVTLDSGSVSNHSIQWSDGSNQWNRYNLQSGNYSFMITNTDGCMYFDEISFTTNGPSFDYLNSIEVMSANQEIDDLNGDGKVSIKGTVIIQSGVDYLIEDKELVFAENTDLPIGSDYPSSGIVVKPGASLRLENSSIDVAEECVSYWGGIEVWSNGLNEEGKLEIFNSTVEHARIGVSTLPKTLIGQPFVNGGKVLIRESLFKNNLISINLEGKHGSKMLNHVENSDFLITENISNATHIIAKEQQFGMQNCLFEGNDSLPQSSRGTAIYLDDAQFIDVPLNLPAGAYNAQFYNMNKALYSENNTSHNLLINNVLFDNNKIGLQLKNAKDIIVNNSTFKMNSGSYGEKVNGIFQSHSSSAIISNNKFIGSGNTFTKGIVMLSQVNFKSTVSKNEFEGQMYAAIEFVGINEIKELSCNNFDLINGTDVIVSDHNDINGNLTLESDLLLNDFSSCTEVNTNVDFSSSASLFTYVDYEAYSPHCAVGNIEVQTISAAVDRESRCKFSYMNSLELNSTKNTDEETAKLTEESASDVGLYPNPNNGSFSIVASSTTDEVQILNSNGQLVKSIEQKQFQAYQSFDLSAGVYSVIYLQQGEAIDVVKMVVQ